MNTTRIPFLALLWGYLLSTSAYAQEGLVGEYYNGTNFDQKVLTRIDPRIHFSWYNKGPAPGVNESSYSIRWTGRLKTPKTGRYKFSAKVDDGIRLWIDDKKIIDAWRPNDWGEFEGSIDLVANHIYNLKVEFYNGIYEGEIQLYWVLPGEGGTISSFFGKSAKPIEAQYFLQPIPKNTHPIVPPKNPLQAPPKASKPVTTTTAPQKRRDPPKRQTPAVSNDASAPVAPAPAPPAAEELRQRQKALELKHIYFVRSTDELIPASKEILDNWSIFLKQKPDAHIEIFGHTDDLGNPVKNQELSEQRAALVAKYLTEHGVEAAKIKITGCGGSKPIFVNPANEKERAVNRRVEIRVKR